MTSAKVPARHGEEFHKGDATALVARLTKEGAKRIHVDGGAVIQQFLAAGLLTDMTVSVVPILLGDGVPLFGKTGRDVRLTLVKSRAFESGLLQLEYHPGKTTRRKSPRKMTAEGSAKGRSRDRNGDRSRPADLNGFLLSLPEDATSADVCRLAHEFGIKGPVYVESYSAPGDHIMMDIVDGEEGPWSVTRYPRDMDG
jgi:hypothetical protein